MKWQSWNWINLLLRNPRTRSRLIRRSKQRKRRRNCSRRNSKRKQRRRNWLRRNKHRRKGIRRARVQETMTMKKRIRIRRRGSRYRVVREIKSRRWWRNTRIKMKKTGWFACNWWVRKTWKMFQWKTQIIKRLPRKRKVMMRKKRLRKRRFPRKVLMLLRIISNSNRHRILQRFLSIRMESS